MDFHSLTRKELQSLCKLNKIPANITNVAMADALQSLEIVVGIEDFLEVSQSVTADPVESVEKVEVSSVKAPQTRCRASTQKKVKTTETETFPSTVTRTTRRGSRQQLTEVEESKIDLLKTPAISRTSRKTLATSSRRNVNSQLNECENEFKDEVMVENKYSTRRSTRLTEKKLEESRVKKGIEKAVKIDSFVDQVNVKSKEPVEVPGNSMERGNSNAEVEDICNAFEKLDVVVMEEEVTHKNGEDDDCGEGNNLKQESDENSHLCEGGNLEEDLKISEVKIDEGSDVKPESEGISNPSETDCSEVNDQNQKSDETSNSFEDGDLEDNLMICKMKIDEVYDVKPESDDISSPSEEATQKGGVEDEDSDNNLKQESHETSNSFEDEDLEDKLKISKVTIGEVYDVKPESDDICPSADDNLAQKPHVGDNITSAMKEHNRVMLQEEHSEENLEQKLNLGADTELGHEDRICADSEMDNQVPQTIESSTMVSSMIIDNTPDLSTMTEEVEDHKPRLSVEHNVNEKSDADSDPTQNPLTLSDVTGHQTHVTPIKNATPCKNTSIVVSDDKENIVDEGNVGKKEKDEMEKIKNFNETSLRQLRKQLKALTLKNLNSKQEAAAAAPRQALQALCENQMVIGGETEN